MAEKRFIDANQFRGKHEVAEVNGKLNSVILYADIVNAKTEDVVEVVRCKDCKHLMFSDCYGECSKAYLGIVSPNDYCSCGERKGQK